MLPTFRDDALDLLEDHDLELSFVDAGARNGVLELRDIAEHVHAFGFEPHPEEYRKLVEGETEQIETYGFGEPDFASLEYHQLALSDEAGRAEFYLTPGAAAAGLDQPNLDRLREINQIAGKIETNFADYKFADWDKTEVDVTTLDNFCENHGINHVDYLKIDVEGGEYDLLQGATSTLPRTGVIRVETCFIPFREGQKLFSDVDLLLRDHGFDLLRHETVQDQVGYKEREGPWMYHPDQMPDRWGQPLWCDAIYVNREIDGHRRALAQAIVLLQKWYLDEALHILKERTKVHDPDLFERLRTYEGGSRGQRWRARGYKLVDDLVDAGAKVLSRMGL